MERSGRSAPAVHDHGDLRDLYHHDGPFVTVWANRVDPTRRQTASRIQHIRDQVTRQLPKVAMDELIDAVAGALPEAEATVGIGVPSGVLLIEHVPTALRHEGVITGALPALAPVIEHRQAQIAFIIVAVDRRGADLFWSDADGSGSTSVQFDDSFMPNEIAGLPMGRPGGWSHRHFQHRAENLREHTARDVAEEVAHLADAIQPRLIAVAGDIRMIELLRKRLPAEAAELVREVSGGRSEDGSVEHREVQIRKWIRAANAEDTVVAMRLFAQEKGQNERAADGAQATFEAITQARVDTLLIHDDAVSRQMALFVPDAPNLVAFDRRTLGALGRTDGRVARLADVALRSCVLTSAGVRVVPAAPILTDGIGAILRW